MPILDTFDVDPETRQALHVALEKTRRALGLTDNFADGIIANQIVQFAKAGECNPDVLSQAAFEELREHLYSD